MDKPELSQYDVVWETQSSDVSGSMPLGGRDCGFNVWAEDDALCVLLSQSGAFDENGTLLKYGRIRLSGKDRSLFAQAFRQHFSLPDGQIIVQGKHGASGFRAVLWADVHTSRLHIDIRQTRGQALYLDFDCWRYRERAVSKAERAQCRDYEGYEGEVVTYPDVIAAEDGALTFYHRNRPDRLVFDRILEAQGLEELRPFFPNVLRDRIMGGRIVCEQMRFCGVTNNVYGGTDQQTYRFEIRPASSVSILIPLAAGQFAAVEEWESRLRQHLTFPSRMEAVKRWWRDYLSQSYIIMDEQHPGSPVWRIGRNYQLMRYMLGTNAFSPFPSKFNGGLFAFAEEFTPDFRRWSGIDFTAQNQRLLAWPLLKSGDYDGMLAYLRFYTALLPAAEKRVRYIWHHGGACFPEQLSAFGTSCMSEYGWKRRDGIRPGDDDSPWVRYHYSSGLEAAYMMLLRAQAVGRLEREEADFVRAVVQFYAQHYAKGADGKLMIYPSTALESYKGCDANSVSDGEYGCTNPMDAVAGLRAVLHAFMKWQTEDAEKQRLRELLRSVPELPWGAGADGARALLPAEKYGPEPLNSELPELYAAFPYGVHGMLPEVRKMAVQAYLQPRSALQDSAISWHQKGIFAAILGLTEEAKKYALQKMSDGPFRFPAFWGPPGQDGRPDLNWGGCGMIQLQEMLLHVEKTGNKLLYAWPEDWPVRFALYDDLGNRVVGSSAKEGERR